MRIYKVTALVREKLNTKLSRILIQRDVIVVVSNKTDPLQSAKSLAAKELKKYKETIRHSDDGKQTTFTYHNIKIIECKVIAETGIQD